MYSANNKDASNSCYHCIYVYYMHAIHKYSGDKSLGKMSKWRQGGELHINNFV